MKSAQNSVAPLSMFMWGAPAQVVVAPGSRVGKVADVRHLLTDLTVNFKLIVDEFAHPYDHPVFEACQSHPVHTRAINRRQFDVLRYGMILDEAERLVLLPVPRDCLDSGVSVARDFKAIFNESLDGTEVSRHPLLPEYTFIVVRLPPDVENEEDATAIPKPLFRIVFRNEAFGEAAIAEMCDTFPLFRLRSVTVPGTTYAIMQEIYEYRQNHSGVFQNPTTGALLPNPKVEKILHSDAISDLTSTWLKVLDGIAPAWVKEKGVGPDVVDLFLKTHRAKHRGPLYSAVQDREADYTAAQVDNRVRLNYIGNNERMRKRVQVVKREPGFLNDWRDGAFDIEYYGEESKGAQPEMKKASCARMLMRLTRNGENSIVDNEICAFVPEAEEYKQQRVYRTAAAERLRLWVLKGLMTAELHNVHAVLLEVDTALILSQCVGLLFGDGEEKRQGEAMFHVAKIIVETVEDYVQHSGVIWQATVVVSDEQADKAVQLCKEILQATQNAKARVESQERLRYLNKDEEEVERVQRRELFEQHVREKAAKKLEGSGSTFYDRVVASVNGGDDGSLVVRNQSVALLSHYLGKGIPKAVAARASLIGFNIDDESLYAVYESMLPPMTSAVPIGFIVEVLMEKLESGRNASGHWPNDNPLLHLDSCGVPCNRKTVTDFVMGFCRRPYRASTSAGRGTPVPPTKEAEPAMNYVEFSIMMLALSHQ